MSSTPPGSGARADPLASILGSAEWLSRPRHASGSNCSPAPPNSGGVGELTGASSSRGDGNRSGKGWCLSSRGCRKRSSSVATCAASVPPSPGCPPRAGD